MSGDRIELRGLRAVGAHGVLPEERERAQPFEVDIDIEVDLSAAGATDDLSDTLDYGALAAAAEKVVATEHHALLERLAHRIAEEVGGDPRVSAVRVSIRKLRPPVPLDLATAGVTVTRVRGS
jgi:dihydroneopterin aldolase